MSKKKQDNIPILLIVVVLIRAAWFLSADLRLWVRQRWGKERVT